MKNPIINVLAGLTVFIFLLCAAIEKSFAQIKSRSTSQVSLSFDGSNGGTPAGSSRAPVVAQNGKFVVFGSSAENVVSNDSNGAADVFIRDIKVGSVTRASIASTGAQGDADSAEHAISPVTPEGLFAVAFSSNASNFGSIANPNFEKLIILRLPTLGITENISIRSTGQFPRGASSQPAVTVVQNPDRVLVTFVSDADNLVDGDVNHHPDVFLVSGQIPASGSVSELRSSLEIIKVSGGGGSSGANGSSDSPKISGDGRYIVYVSNASNLVHGKITSRQQVFLYDISSGETTLISQASDSSQANGDCNSPVISFSGRYVAYVSNATNLVHGTSSDKSSIVLHDLLKRTIKIINSDEHGTVSNGDATAPTISGNGRFIAFSDDGTNLVSGESDSFPDVFVKDLNDDSISKISNGFSANADNRSEGASVSGTSFNSLSGSIFFQSLATNLTENSTPIGKTNVYLTDVVLRAPQLARGSRIETPADVSLRKRRPVISAQKFAFPKKQRARLTHKNPTTLPARKTARKSVTYEFRVEGSGKRRKVRLKLIGKRNTITASRLKPGVYNTRYRVKASEGNKVVSKTPFSPRQSFTIN